ncbi:helix-turn-helix domain-containing protein [Nannocystis punicea]|uniref:Helix-turn-helix domain-containing protein n=1 Tax=Nannocystis punicea TaxID=2995304 RepID=A0ABY7HG85_9BACT|nr:helix-turn-helix domain-containing protein [Nannocystis poenicansa]WAS97999.1 helix-turn-helix domain-containing protein [Nannocystis poenicansa]
MSATWTIRELGRQAEQRLASDEAPANGQVRAVPDERSIRYYTTLGLLDRPTLQGRTALYGPRHLAQLIAIKRLQAEGKSLAEIQRLLPTLDDATLARLSGVALHPAPRTAGRRDFWRHETPIGEVEPARSDATGTAAIRESWNSLAPIEPAAPTPAPATAPALTPTLELPLAPGVRLAFTPTRPATDADAAALLAAAAPLLAELARRGLALLPDSLAHSLSADPEPQED